MSEAPDPAGEARADPAAAFDLAKFTNDLIGDLDALRAGEISVRDARARAELARQVLRAVHYVVLAQKYIQGQAKAIEGPKAGGLDAGPDKSRGRGRPRTIDA